MSSDLYDLNPLFMPVAQSILKDCTSYLNGQLIKPAVTFRSLNDQAAARAAGLSQVSIGWHQFGLAMDVAIYTDAGVYITDGSDPAYATFGKVAKLHGCIWGGDWMKADWDHCEYHPAFTLQQYIAWLDAHRVVTA